MAVFIGATRAKYYVYFMSKKLRGFGNKWEANEYIYRLEKEDRYPRGILSIKHKGKTIY
jgi:hypothetical protein